MARSGFPITPAANRGFNPCFPLNGGVASSRKSEFPFNFKHL